MLPLGASAQEPEYETHDTLSISLRDVLPSRGIRYDFIDDTILLNTYLSSLTVSFPSIEDTCSLYLSYVQRLQRQMSRMGNIRDGKVWVDSITYIHDYFYYRDQMSFTVTLLQRNIMKYRQLEQQRIEAERQIARELARKAQAETDEKAAEIIAVIEKKDKQIESITLAHGVSDKLKVRELKLLWFAYLRIFNQYNLTPINVTEQQLARINELLSFQQQLLDSVLLESGLPNQIERFPNQLRERAGKDHADVYRSYIKVMRTPLVSAQFTSLEGYQQYIQQMQIITTVQRSYLYAITLRERIASGSIDILNRCKQRHRDISDSYRNALSSINLIPAYSTIAESELFESQLEEFIQVQGEYLNNINHIDNIIARGDSIVSIVPRAISDVANSYRQLQNTTSLVPDYHTLKGAQFFERSLTDFEQLQNCYIRIVDLRMTIARKGDSITSSKTSPKGLSNSYKTLRGQRNFVANFRLIDAGQQYINMLENYITLQNQFLAILDRNNTINQQSDQIQQSCKENYSHIFKAHQHLLKSHNLEAIFVRDEDLQRYAAIQNNLLAEQKHILNIMLSPSEAIKVNEQLKGEKDVNHIKLAIGVK